MPNVVTSFEAVNLNRISVVVQFEFRRVMVFQQYMTLPYWDLFGESTNMAQTKPRRAI